MVRRFVLGLVLLLVLPSSIQAQPRGATECKNPLSALRLDDSKGIGAEVFHHPPIWTQTQLDKIHRILNSFPSRTTLSGGRESEDWNNMEVLMLTRQGVVDLFLRPLSRSSRLLDCSPASIHALTQNLQNSLLGKVFPNEDMRSLGGFLEKVFLDFKSHGPFCRQVHLSIGSEKGFAVLEGHSHAPTFVTYLKREQGRHTMVRRDGKAKKPLFQWWQMIEVEKDDVLVLKDAWHKTPKMDEGDPRVIVVVSVHLDKSPQGQ